MRELLQLWRQASTWWSLVHVLVSGVTGTIAFVVLFPLTVASIALLITFPLAVPVIWLASVTARGLACVERARFASLLDVRIHDPVEPLPEGSWWSRLWARPRSRQRWKELGYLLLSFPVGLALSAVALLAWASSLALVGLPLYAGRLPGGTAKFWLFEIGPGLGAFAVALVAMAVVVIGAPWVTIGAARVDALFAQWLLGWHGADLAAEVTRLERSRVSAVDSAEAERRRIERDLHDGAQQRLVAVAMGLGVARERIGEDPESGCRLVAEAHEEAKAALKDLRDLVRGVHPAILDDRGLDAALSSVVARTPVPVSLEVDVPERLPAPVESTAYFIVSEALTNVARHAQASGAAVTITTVDNRLVIQIRDDGVGGAEPAIGTGLRGLEDRANALGGSLKLTSPTGGPTTLIAELPCVS